MDAIGEYLQNIFEDNKEAENDPEKLALAVKETPPTPFYAFMLQNFMFHTNDLEVLL